MRINRLLAAAVLTAAMPASFTTMAAAAPKAVEIPLTATGTALEKKYADLFKSLQADIAKVLPAVSDQQKSAFDKARGLSKAAETGANAAQQALGRIAGAKGLVDHAKGKWIGGAEKGIAQAEAALKKATTDAEREAAKTDLAKWQANKEDGLKALKERQETLDKAKADEPELTKAHQAAQASLAKARGEELETAKALLSKLETCLATDQLDAKLLKCTVLADATPRGLAEFAQQGADQEALVNQLLANDALMKHMLEAGGAKFGKYGRAMEILNAIRKASPKSSEGVLPRLALATSLEHAKPVEQSNAGDQTNAPATVDPVKRYLHYEKAFLDGELDPAFKSLAAWELRLVVGCDAPDEILAWGRAMLRNYRPDHIYNPDYGWRYVSTVRTEVPYGSQNVKYDIPTLHKYQNIILNGGVCGRRAFFGRYILQCFGIPTWGVTQKAHAALSHWTPKGWVVNLGAGYEHSWWDKDEAPRSGSDFLLETQARAHGEEYLKVQRAQWIGRVLGEQPYNDRRNVAGGFWSNIARYQALALAATAAKLGPLGQELAEANESKDKQKAGQAKLAEADKKATVDRDGTITIPAVAHGKAAGSGAAMKSFTDGMQLHCTGGFRTEYEVNAPSAGKYMLTAQVVTVQKGQKFTVAANDGTGPGEIDVPYTIGKWEQTRPLEVILAKGTNKLSFSLQDGSRGVTIKHFTLKPAGGGS
jgi:hypothetical protein